MCQIKSPNQTNYSTDVWFTIKCKRLVVYLNHRIKPNFEFGTASRKKILEFVLGTVTALHVQKYDPDSDLNIIYWNFKFFDLCDAFC